MEKLYFIEFEVDLELDEQIVLAQEAIDEYKGLCQDCGQKKGVWGYCPYAYDINDEKVLVFCCDYCWQERADDI